MDKVFQVIGAQRLLEPVYAVVGQHPCTTQRPRITALPVGVAAAGVHHQLVVVPDNLAGGGHDLLIQLVADAAEGTPAHLEGAEALLLPHLQFVAQRGRLVHQQRGIGPDPFPVTPAEQAADRLSRDLAQNVPHRDVNSADRVRDGAAASHPKRVLVQPLTHPFRFDRGLTDKERAQHLQRGQYKPVVGEDGTVSGDAFIRFDKNKRVDAVFLLQLLAPAALRGRAAQARRAYLCDLHLCSSSV